jgi:hypothetical protein
MLMELQERRGFEMSVATRCALAMMPLDDGVQPSRGFAKKARKLSKKSSKAFQGTDEAGWDAIAFYTLMLLRDWAVEYGEPYYSQKYDQVLFTPPFGSGDGTSPGQ